MHKSLGKCPADTNLQPHREGGRMIQICNHTGDTNLHKSLGKCPADIKHGLDDSQNRMTQICNHTGRVAGQCIRMHMIPARCAAWFKSRTPLHPPPCESNVQNEDALPSPNTNVSGSSTEPKTLDKDTTTGAPSGHVTSQVGSSVQETNSRESPP
jgi:hypothetical protein